MALIKLGVVTYLSEKTLSYCRTVSQGLHFTVLNMESSWNIHEQNVHNFNTTLPNYSLEN